MGPHCLAEKRRMGEKSSTNFINIYFKLVSHPFSLDFVRKIFDDRWWLTVGDFCSLSHYTYHYHLSSAPHNLAAVCCWLMCARQRHQLYFFLAGAAVWFLSQKDEEEEIFRSQALKNVSSLRLHTRNVENPWDAWAWTINGDDDNDGRVVTCQNIYLSNN